MPVPPKSDFLSGVPDSRNNLGVLLIQKGWVEEALKEFRLAAATRPYDEEIQVNLVRALLAVGQKDEAEQCFRTALDIYPGFEPARQQLDLKPRR